MYTHRDADYDCPFCRIVRGEDVGGNGSKQTGVNDVTRSEGRNKGFKPLAQPQPA